ncbi:hypothetical protein FOBRF1_014022 [Fusarium oxysporum]
MSNDSNMKPCALLFGEAGPIIAATPSLGLCTKVEVRVGTATPPCANPSFGFTLTFSRDPGQVTSEKEGRGVCYAYDPSSDKPVPSDFTITVKFPRGSISCSHLLVPAVIQTRFPKVQDWQGFTYLIVRLDDSSHPTIEGYRKEYFNSPDPKLQGWRAFSFIVELPIASCGESMGDQNLPGLFTYGYPCQPADVQEMKALVDKKKGGDFPPCYAFDNDEAHITAINQSVIQDTLWIAEERLLAYFATPIRVISEGNAVHLVVLVPKAWRDLHDLAWLRLTAGNPLIKVKIHDISTPGHTGPALWTGKIIGSNNSAPELRTHPIQDHELINSVTLVFDSRMAEVEKKVNNMRMFAPSALPTNRQAWRMALDGAGNLIAPHMLNTDQRQTYDRVMFQMDVHRAVLRGTGFYKVLSRETNGLGIGALPSMCYRLYDDRYLMQCIIEEAGYHQRKRFREYLMGRELNIGLIIGPPGSGKTTFGAAAALAMQVQLGQILCSGPSHASIDIFAHRLDQRARAVAARYNTVMPAGDAERCHHRLVIRIYRPGDEINAVTQLLRDPQDVDWAARRVLRSNAVPPLHVDSKPGLVNLQADIDTRPLCCIYVSGRLGRSADFLCVHPSDAEVSPITHWKRILARGLAVDEAGSMSRADFYGLWGNTLLPCFLVGDPNKNPVVLTTDEKDADGNLYNRFAADGAVSPLKFLMATGIPVFRLEDSTRR